MRKSIFSIALSSCLVIPYHAFAENKITDCTMLQNMSVGGEYVLANDIDCTGVDFIPIGNTTTPFTGSLNGAGHKISQLSISKSNQDFVGLFGVAKGATISALSLENANIKGKGSLGALVGRAEGAKITNVSASGTVSSESGNSEYIGGLIGVLRDKSTLSGGVSSINVWTIGDSNSIGGLAGGVVNASIEKSHATGKVVGYYDTGGLVGYFTSGSITDSFATGDVTLSVNDYYTGKLGGLIGSLDVSGSATVLRTYATGNVNIGTGTGDAVGGLIGYVYGGPTISNSFARGNVEARVDVGGLIGEAFAIKLSNSCRENRSCLVNC